MQLIHSTSQEAVQVTNKKFKLCFLTMYHLFLKYINFYILSRAKHLPPKCFEADKSLLQSMKYIGKIVLDSPSPGTKAMAIVVDNYWNKINRYLDKAFMPMCDFFQRQKGPAHMLNFDLKSVFV